jgi:glycosyltransferase involved in cell wall biosynthesis
MAKADLRVHSRHSDRPTNFFLKKLKAPESLTEPEAAYALAKRRGMDFVTLTDSDTVAGCLELAHHPDVFASCETVAAFPEDECKIRLLIFGLNEQQLQRTLGFRRDLFRIRDYLCAEGLVHAVATPLDILNSRLAPDHIERLLLLFDHFETHSGGRHARTNDFLTALLDHLTPELMRMLQKKWNIEPARERPWQKGYIGGSGDYSGQLIGLTWTDVPMARTPQDFLDSLRRGEGTPGGLHGSTLSNAHSIYRVALQYYQRNLRQQRVHEPDIVSLVLSRVLQSGPARPHSMVQTMGAAVSAVRRLFSVRRRATLHERRLVREFIRAYASVPSEERLAHLAADDPIRFDERLCGLVDRVIGRVSHQLIVQATREFERGRIGNAFTLGSTVVPLQALLGPYLHSFSRLNRDRPLVADLEERFGPYLELPHQTRRQKWAWFSDTVNDVNGVSRTLHKMAAVAEELDEDLKILTSVLPQNAPTGTRFLNFEPMGEISVPDYELQKLTIPPGLRILHHLENTPFTEYVISTPGPMGLLALLASRLFHVPCRAIYHNDFPQHVRHITGDEALEEVAWTYMRWFYGRADAVYAPSTFYRDQLVEHGFDPSRLFLFNRGTDLELFNPRHRDERFYDTYGLRGRTILTYIGRVSREKNLDVLCAAFAGDPELSRRAGLAVVGDGPYLSELRERYVHPAIVFCGFVQGKALSRAYASSDVFVFPSTTDTYGNSVLEAQASGLPAIVSDEGGPRDIIAPDDSGLICPGHDVEAWRRAMLRLVFDREQRLRMAAAARARAATRDWTTAFCEFWHDRPHTVPLSQLPARRSLVR